MAESYPFQEYMIKKMEGSKWSQNELARLLSEKLGRTIHASTVNRLLASKVTIPGGDVLSTLAELLDVDPAAFIASVYATRYSGDGLQGELDFIFQEIKQVDEATRRKIINTLLESKKEGNVPSQSKPQG